MHLHQYDLALNHLQHVGWTNVHFLIIIIIIIIELTPVEGSECCNRTGSVPWASAYSTSCREQARHGLIVKSKSNLSRVSSSSRSISGVVLHCWTTSENVKWTSPKNAPLQKNPPLYKSTSLKESKTHLSEKNPPLYKTHKSSVTAQWWAMCALTWIDLRHVNSYFWKK